MVNMLLVSWNKRWHGRVLGGTRHPFEQVRLQADATRANSSPAKLLAAFIFGESG